MRQYMASIPNELLDAARIDGAGVFGAFWRIVVPNSGAFFSAIGVITFVVLYLIK